MPFVEITHVVLAELRYLWDGQKCENTLYFELDTPPDVTNMQALGDALADWWATQLKPQTSSAVTLNLIHLTDLTSDTGPAIDVTTGLPQSGSVASTAAPNNVSLAVKFSTALRGRSFRGRNYILGIIPSVLTENVVSDAFAAAIVAAYENLLDPATLPSGATWVVASRFHNNAPRLIGVTAPITAVSVTDKVVDSMRRRLPGRGR